MSNGLNHEGDLDYLRFLGRYFLVLSCRVHDPSSDKSTVDTGRYYAASGFVVSVHGVWFLITAGHVLADIETHQERGYTFTHWQLDDTFALAQKRTVKVDGPMIPETIPFDFDSAAKYKYFSEEDGLDFAFIHLSEYYERNLKANNVTAFAEEDWFLTEEWESAPVASRMELVGVPEDQTIELTTIGLVQKTLVAIPLSRIEDESLYDDRFRHMLQAHVPEIPFSGLPTFKHIRGMSGGPIIGFWRQPDGSERMQLIGIQSRWYSRERTIAATPIGTVAQCFQELMEKIQQVVDEQNARKLDK